MAEMSQSDQNETIACLKLLFHLLVYKLSLIQMHIAWFTTLQTNKFLSCAAYAALRDAIFCQSAGPGYLSGGLLSLAALGSLLYSYCYSPYR